MSMQCRQAGRQRNLIQANKKTVYEKGRNKKLYFTLSLECECFRFLFPGFFPEDVQWDEATEISDDGELFFCCEMLDSCSTRSMTLYSIPDDDPAADDDDLNDDNDDASDEFWVVLLLLHLLTQFLLLVFEELPFVYLEDWKVLECVLLEPQQQHTPCRNPYFWSCCKNNNTANGR